MALIAFEITRRQPYAAGQRFGDTGAYEQVDGRALFAVDPRHPANAAIVDLALAPQDDDGRVRFTADLSVLMPADPSRGARRALVELPNRGRMRAVPVFNMGPSDAPVSRSPHPGDGFLFRHGFTVVSVGWQWDVFSSDVLLGLEAPLALRDGKPIGGQTMVEIRPSAPVCCWLLADRNHRPLPAADLEQHDAVLYVREFEDGEDRVIPRERWRFARERDGRVLPCAEHVYLDGGFTPGCIYQLVYLTDRAPIAGTGLLALRDVAPFLRDASAHNPTAGGFDAIHAWGVSQTGRMLREYLYLGLNRDEHGARAYDGIHAHVAGARRGSFNHRFAQPSNQTTPLWGHGAPFADLPSDDALSGSRGGLLDRLRGGDALPKVIYTDSAAEYWRGDAALAHIDTAGKADLPESPDTRRYLFASAQHGAGYIGQSRYNDGVKTTARDPLNLLDYRPLLRAVLLNLDAWVRDGVAPPDSRHPRIADASAVPRERALAYYARLPGFEVPDAARLPFVRTMDLGGDEAGGIARFPAREGAFYPALVSALDEDGNEIAGVRMPDVSVPVGSHTGWNPRDPKTGAPEQIVPMNGLTRLFATTRAQREASGDPRPSIAERYPDRDDYATRVRAAADALVAERYLLAEDLEACVAAALERYDAAANGAPISADQVQAARAAE